MRVVAKVGTSSLTDALGVIQRDVIVLLCDQLAELRRGAVPGNQVVEDDDAVAGALQPLGRVAADVTGAAGDEHGARASAQWKNT